MGEVVLAKEHDMKLRLYKYLDGVFTEVKSARLSKSLDARCWKECNDGRVILQHWGEKAATIVLNADTLSKRAVLQNRGRLIGCLPQGDRVYLVEEDDGYVLKTGISGITLASPSGSWKNWGLSLCGSNNKIFVTESRGKSLDVFSQKGEV